jgi:hypothetical protein
MRFYHSCEDAVDSSRTASAAEDEDVCMASADEDKDEEAMTVHSSSSFLSLDQTSSDHHVSNSNKSEQVKKCRDQSESVDHSGQTVSDTRGRVRSRKRACDDEDEECTSASQVKKSAVELSADSSVYSQTLEPIPQTTSSDEKTKKPNEPSNAGQNQKTSQYKCPLCSQVYHRTPEFLQHLSSHGDFKDYVQRCAAVYAKTP